MLKYTVLQQGEVKTQKVASALLCTDGDFFLNKNARNSGKRLNDCSSSYLNVESDWLPSALLSGFPTPTLQVFYHFFNML